jgi:hypothetical protein
LYGFETKSVVLKEGLVRLGVFEIRVLRRIFEPKWGGVTRNRRKLNNQELHNFYSSPDIIRALLLIIANIKVIESRRTK